TSEVTARLWPVSVRTSRRGGAAGMAGGRAPPATARVTVGAPGRVQAASRTAPDTSATQVASRSIEMGDLPGQCRADPPPGCATGPATVGPSCGILNAAVSVAQGAEHRGTRGHWTRHSPRARRGRAMTNRQDAKTPRRAPGDGLYGLQRT